MTTLNRLQTILIRLEEARIKQNQITLINDRASENLVQTLKTLKYINIIKSTNTHTTIKPTATNGYGITETKVIKNKDLWAKAANLVPTITGTLLLYTRRGVVGHEEASKSKLGGHPFGWVC